MGGCKSLSRLVDCIPQCRGEEEYSRGDVGVGVRGAGRGGLWASRVWAR